MHTGKEGKDSLAVKITESRRPAAWQFRTCRPGMVPLKLLSSQKLQGMILLPGVVTPIELDTRCLFCFLGLP